MIEKRGFLIGINKLSEDEKKSYIYIINYIIGNVSLTKKHVNVLKNGKS